MTTDRAIDILSPLICAYPSAMITEDTIQVYSIALSELQEKELLAGVLKCIRTCKFFPSIAEIIDASQDMVKVMTDTKEKSSDEAWTEVQRQMQVAFIYKKPVFSSLQIEQAALAIGWIGLCETATKDMGTVRAQFRGFYESACKRNKDKQINDYVMGIMGGESMVKNLVNNVCRLMPSA